MAEGCRRGETAKTEDELESVLTKSAMNGFHLFEVEIDLHRCRLSTLFSVDTTDLFLGFHR